MGKKRKDGGGGKRERDGTRRMRGMKQGGEEEDELRAREGGGKRIHHTRYETVVSLVTYLDRGSSQLSKGNFGCLSKVTQLQGSCLVHYSGYCNLCCCYHLVRWLERREGSTLKVHTLVPHTQKWINYERAS